ncbi:MAG: glycosyltransferase [Bacteroidales bacterium]|nr:glycosyltransferase [Bacteroidales bacterium]
MTYGYSSEGPWVSIVIPVFQVEDYIDTCLASVATQTYRRFEVIVVDDCGADRSVERVQAFIDAHPELTVRLLHHTHNRGLSAARNTGMADARGDYVYFLDSDDSLPPEALDRLTTPLRGQDFDFVIGDYETAEGASMLRMPAGPFTDVLPMYAAGAWYVMAWNKLCNIRFLNENNLFFFEALNHEDVIWSFQLACKARSMYVIGESTYRYTVRGASIMTGMSVRKDAELYVRVFDEIRRVIVAEGRTEGRDEYAVFEGKRCGVMYSLLWRGDTELFKELYPQFRRQCYLKPFRAFRLGIIGFGGLLRDLHYALPVRMGARYKQLFFLAVYRLLGRPLRGVIWK